MVKSRAFGRQVGEMCDIVFLGVSVVDAVVMFGSIAERLTAPLAMWSRVI